MRFLGTSEIDVAIVYVGAVAFVVELQFIFGIAFIKVDVAVSPDCVSSAVCVGVRSAAVGRHIERVGAAVARRAPDRPEVLVSADNRPVRIFVIVLKIAEIGQVGDILIGGEDHGRTPFAFRRVGADGPHLPFVFRIGHQVPERDGMVAREYRSVIAFGRKLVGHLEIAGCAVPGEGGTVRRQVGCDRIQRLSTTEWDNGEIVDGGRRIVAVTTVVFPKEIDPLHTIPGNHD